MPSTRGTSKIEVAPLAGDKGVGTVWTDLGNISADSTAQLLQGDPTTKEFFSITSDQPIEKDVTPGSLVLTLSVMDVTAANLERLIGGASTGTTEANKVWSAPLQATVIEQSVKITPKKGKIITIVRAQFSGKVNFSLQKDGLFLIDLIISVLLPEKANTAPYTIGPEV